MCEFRARFHRGNSALLSKWFPLWTISGEKLGFHGFSLHLSRIRKKQPSNSMLYVLTKQCDYVIPSIAVHVLFYNCTKTLYDYRAKFSGG